MFPNKLADAIRLAATEAGRRIEQADTNRAARLGRYYRIRCAGMLTTPGAGASYGMAWRIRVVWGESPSQAPIVFVAELMSKLRQMSIITGPGLVSFFEQTVDKQIVDGMSITVIDPDTVG